ncbi:LLM class flavin-dependent oxidoreductase [Micromonospora sp. NPDC051227]|uniref:LLM class flavin-dependent oxidoreductase n=1 Tax=Micromonospora sp. NPDC051227 TaxID=3364285 RepID=UPI0037900371
MDPATFQDHPYNPGFLDTWTLLGCVAARTQRIRASTNVLTLPLRPPAVLARRRQPRPAAHPVPGNRQDRRLAGANRAVRGAGSPAAQPPPWTGPGGHPQRTATSHHPRKPPRACTR